MTLGPHLLHGLRAGLALVLGTAWACQAAPSADFAAWVPPGWTLTHSATGDLDRDGRDDAALVLQKTDPANLRPNADFGPSELNLNPRRLVVLLRTASGYRQAVATERFIPAEHDADNTCLADPLEGGGVQITRGVLRIDLHYWLSCGSYGVTHRTFSFRFDAPRWRLIGLDSWDFMRNSGERDEVSRNYLTGRQKVTTGLNEFTDGKPQVVWKRIPGPQAFFLDEMGSDCGADPKPGWCEP